MVEDAMPPRSQIRPEGEDHSFIPKNCTARCGNDEHDYDASRYTACPGCGSLDRIMIERVLSPEILHKRLLKALRMGRKQQKEE